MQPGSTRERDQLAIANLQAGQEPRKDEAGLLQDIFDWLKDYLEPRLPDPNRNEPPENV